MIKKIGYLVTILTAISLLGAISFNIKKQIVFADDFIQHVEHTQQQWKQQQDINLRSDYRWYKERLLDLEYEYDCPYKPSLCQQRMSGEVLRNYMELIEIINTFKKQLGIQ
jgi:hypothetical protein